MIFARSRRSSLLFVIVGAAVAITFGAAAAAVFLARGFDLPGAALATGAGLGIGLGAWAGWQLRSWPAYRLGFFRDRLVVVEGRTEQHALWDRIDTASLAAPFDWSGERWPEIQISDRLTIRLRRGKPVSLRPADFGLAPTGCRDFVLLLRDDRTMRVRLPEFDSALDLSERPLVTGELITPRL